MYRIRNKLSRLLGELHLTQADLASMADIREGTLSEYVREINDRISLAHLARICEALECELTDVLELEIVDKTIDDAERWERIQAKKEHARAERRRRYKEKKMEKLKKEAQKDSQQDNKPDVQQANSKEQ